jgi:hypothetical protein
MPGNATSNNRSLALKKVLLLFYSRYLLLSQQGRPDRLGEFGRAYIEIGISRKRIDVNLWLCGRRLGVCG